MHTLQQSSEVVAAAAVADSDAPEVGASALLAQLTPCLFSSVRGRCCGCRCRFRPLPPEVGANGTASAMLVLVFVLAAVAVASVVDLRL